MRRLLVLPTLALALVLAACGGDDDTATGGSTEGSDGMTLSISSPDDGAEVDVPFTVEFDSSVPLGPTDSGEHHVHVFFDGDDSEYQVVEGDSVEITDLPEGEHVVNASLRNADHSAAGVETEITVTVGQGGGGATESDTGGLDY
ncbi:MAG TPA: hypothetical protein VIP77_23400 [Jiangellaceae bacterium]